MHSVEFGNKSGFITDLSYLTSVEINGFLPNLHDIVIINLR